GADALERLVLARVGQVGVQAHDAIERRALRPQDALEITEGLAELALEVRADEVAVVIEAGLAGGHDHVPGADRLREVPAGRPRELEIADVGRHRRLNTSGSRRTR